MRMQILIFCIISTIWGVFIILFSILKWYQDLYKWIFYHCLIATVKFKFKAVKNYLQSHNIVMQLLLQQLLQYTYVTKLSIQYVGKLIFE